MINIIERYISAIMSDEFHRYKSWDHCFSAFSNSKQTEVQVLELAFYLASWGMYRGSSGLLQKNHLIHKGAVGIVFSTASQRLKCNKTTEVKREDIDAILDVKNQLTGHYSCIFFTKGADNSKSISPTDTLLSKIMLGTLGCVPAYDRYFIDGLKLLNMLHTAFNESSLNELFDFLDNNKGEIEEAQNFVGSKTGRHYPLMKILDMFFWQIGFNKDLKDKKKKKLENH